MAAASASDYRWEGAAVNGVYLVDVARTRPTKAFAIPDEANMSFPDATTITATGTAVAAILTALTGLIRVWRGDKPKDPK